MIGRGPFFANVVVILFKALNPSLEAIKLETTNLETITHRHDQLIPVQEAVFRHEVPFFLVTKVIHCSKRHVGGVLTFQIYIKL